MQPHDGGSTRAEIEAAHAAHLRRLRALARELGIPRAEARKLIEHALNAALVRKGNVDVDRWLDATLTAAAKRRGERGE